VVMEVRECPPSTLKNVDGKPLTGADEDPGASTINAKNIDGAPPLTGADGDPVAPTINVKKHQWRAPSVC
jgi:hypothetical protein